MNKIVLLLLVSIVFSVSACTGTNKGREIGYWLDTFPSKISIWQCVEPFAPHRNEEC